MKKILKNFKKNVKFFDKNLCGKLTFSHFLNISGISASSPKVYTPGRLHQFSTTIFQISDGELTGVPPPPGATVYPITFETFGYLNKSHKTKKIKAAS